MVHRDSVLHSEVGHKYWCEIPAREARFSNSSDQKKLIASTLKFRQRTLGDRGRREGIPSKQSLRLYLPKCPNRLKATRLAKEVGGDLMMFVVGQSMWQWTPKHGWAWEGLCTPENEIDRMEICFFSPCFTSPLFTLCSHNFLIRGICYDTSGCHYKLIQNKVEWFVSLKDILIEMVISKLKSTMSIIGVSTIII